MPRQPLILLAEDDESHRRMLRTVLEDWGYTIREAKDGEEAVELAQKLPLPDLTLMDIRMPRKTGLEALPEILAGTRTMPIVLMTAFSDLESAVLAIRQGAWNYVAKPLDFTKLRAILEEGLHRRPHQTHAPVNHSQNHLLGNSAPMRALEQIIGQVAPSEATLLITGESGTGKELAARAVHELSKRASGPFVAVNCGAFNESLLTSELFGHEKGAFTGAMKKHPGLFLQADKGTIFLDEIGEMSASMQVKLLRVLQEREILAVGSTQPVPIDCRILAATHRDLAREVSAGRFREDLYYRLNVVTLRLPPLRERGGDIPLLANFFARKYAAANGKEFVGITSAAMQALERWSWPGNVRELENTMERGIILMPGAYIGPKELPDHLLEEAAAPSDETTSHRPDDHRELLTLEQVERRVIMETLKRLNYNKTETAKALGITRKTLHQKLNRYREEEQPPSSDAPPRAESDPPGPHAD